MVCWSVQQFDKNTQLRKGRKWERTRKRRRKKETVGATACKEKEKMHGDGD